MKALITGGCGFIDCNTASRLQALGHRVVLFDNLSRYGAGHNLTWLRSRGRFEFVRGDVRDGDFVAGIGAWRTIRRYYSPRRASGCDYLST